jgi:Protein of unknown function (DUF3618)
MATSTNNRRTPEEVRREIEVERDQLAASVDHLRAEVAEVTDIGSKIRARLPVVAAGALGAGFFLAGGVGATMRLLARRGREGRTKARVGRFSFVGRD